MFKNVKSLNIKQIISVILALMILVSTIPSVFNFTLKGKSKELGILSGGGFETDDLWKNADGRKQSDTAFEGDYIVKGTAAYKYSQGFAVEKSTDYTVSFWYRNPTASDNDRFAVAVLKGTRKTVSTSVVLEETLNWKHGVLTVNSASYEQFFLGVKGSDVEIDAVSIANPIKSNSELIGNTSFEEGTEGWTSIDGGEIAISVGAEHGFVCAEPQSGKNGGMFYDFKTSPNNDYVVTFDYKGGGADAYFGIARCRDGYQESDLITEKQPLENSNEWKSATLTFSSAGRTDHRLVLFVGESGSVKFDNVSVKMTYSGNLLQNPGFEDGINNWSHNSDKHKVTEDANNGDYALQLPVDGSYTRIWQSVEVEENTEYQISFWYKGTTWMKWSVCDGTNDGTEGYQPNTDGGEGYIYGESKSGAAPAWTQVSVTVNSGSYKRLALAFMHNVNWNIKVDDCVIRKSTKPKDEALIKNGSFEESVSNWWTSGSFSTGSDATDGVSALKIHNGNYDKIGQLFQVKAGKKYVLMFNHKGDMPWSRWAITSGGEANKKNIEKGSDGFIIGEPFGSSETWKTVVSQAFIPETDDTYCVKFQTHTGNKGDCFIDNVMVFEYSDSGSLIVNGNFEGTANGWNFDGSYFELSNENYDGNSNSLLALSSDKNKTVSQAFAVEPESNYELSFYYKGVTPDGAATWGISTTGDFSYKSVVARQEVENSDDWKKVTAVFSSGKNNALNLLFNTVGECEYYIDNVTVVKTDKAPTVSAAKRPYYVTSHSKNPYNDYPHITTEENNLFKDFSFENGHSFVGKSVSVVSDGTAYYGENFLRFTAGKTEESAYSKLSLKKNTSYEITLLVRTGFYDGSEKKHVSFGIADPDSGYFIRPENDTNEASRIYKDKIMFVPYAADNEWHIHSFEIATNDYDTLYFKIFGTNASIDLDYIHVFEKGKGTQYRDDIVSKLNNVTLTNEKPQLLGTKKDSDNLIDNFEFNNGTVFWNQTSSIALEDTISIEDSGHSVQKDTMHYAQSNKYPRRYYYIRWIDVKPNTEYTFSAKCSIAKKGGGKFGLISGYNTGFGEGFENLIVPTAIGSISFDEDYNENSSWQTLAFSFNSNDRNRVGMFVYDGGGEAYIDDVRMFETANAALLTEKTDNFPKTLVSSDKDIVISGGNITGIASETKISQIRNKLENKEYIRVFDINGKEITDYSLCVATGTQFRLMDGPEIKDKATAIINGDINGDSKVNSTDIKLIIKHLAKQEKIEEPYSFAADFDKDGEITIYDINKSAKAPENGEVTAKISGPEAFAIGDEIDVTLSLDKDNIKGLNGLIKFSDGLNFMGIKSDLGDDWAVSHLKSGTELLFALGNVKSNNGVAKDKILLTLTFEIGDISNLSDAYVKINELFATTGDDLLTAKSVSWIGGKKPTVVPPTEGTTSTVTVQAKNRLASLSLKEAKIYPEFAPEVKEYTATVPNSVDKVTVTAVAENEDAKVTIGDTNLEYIGKNIVKVQVTAATGERRTYTIIITRLPDSWDLEDEHENNYKDSDSFEDDVTDIGEEGSEKNLPNSYLSELSLKEAEISPEFSHENQEYTATVPFKVEKVNVTAVAMDENSIVRIGDTNLEYVGKNLVQVQVEATNGEKRIYKISVTREAPTSTEADSGFPTWAIILICVGGALLIASGTFVVIMLVKRKKGQKKA